MQVAAHRQETCIHLCLDNTAALHTLARGRASSLLAPHNRILRRMNYLLHWSGLVVALHHLPSALNPADPPSRWWSYPDPTVLLSTTWGLAASLLSNPQPSPWGTLHGSS